MTYNNNCRWKFFQRKRHLLLLLFTHWHEACSRFRLFTNLVGAGFRGPALGRIFLVLGDALGVLGVRISREILQKIKIGDRSVQVKPERNFTHAPCGSLYRWEPRSFCICCGSASRRHSFLGIRRRHCKWRTPFFSLFGSLSPLSNFHSCTHFSFTCCLQVLLFDLRGSVYMRTFSSPMFWFVKDGEFCESHSWMNRDSPGVWDV